MLDSQKIKKNVGEKLLLSQWILLCSFYVLQSVFSSSIGNYLLEITGDLKNSSIIPVLSLWEIFTENFIMHI